METILWVGTGGFIGANVRYFMTLFINRLLEPRFGAFPFGTMFVNVTGSLLLAVFSVWVSGRLGLSPNVKLLVGTGFFGAYTTFSTFANEGVELAKATGISTFLIYVIVTNVLCLVGVGAGIALANRIFTA